MSDANAPFARLFTPTELPVRIPDWPEDVGMAVCRLNGKTVAFLPYHVEETGQVLRRRLPEEGGENLTGLSFYPALRGAGEAKIGYAEDQRILSDLEQALRTMPRLVEMVHDFAINFAFAEEEGLGLNTLNEAARRKNSDAAAAAAAQKAATEQLPVGYIPYDKPDTNSEVISGAILRPAGAAGIDLVLVPETGLPSREIPPEVSALVREDSLRVAIPLGGVLINGRVPNIIRLPAGSLLLGGSGGKPVPAMVLRRGNFMFVAPDYHAVSAPAMAAPKVARKFPFKAIGLGLGAIFLLAGLILGGLFFILPRESASTEPQAPVESLRSDLFAPKD